MSIAQRPEHGPNMSGFYSDEDVRLIALRLAERSIVTASIADLLDVAVVAAREGWMDQADKVVALCIEMAGGDTSKVIEARTND